MLAEKFYLVITILLISITFPLSFAQHHGGQQAPPVSFGSGQVTVTTSLIPADFIPGKNPDANLKIRFFDTSTNSNIESVTYRVQIFYGTQLVANQMFFDRDGELDIKIQPQSQCVEEELWRCTKYYGETDPIVPNALTSSASSKPVISGPVFTESGKYTVKTAIIGAKNPRTQTAEDINFETKIIVPKEQQFIVTNNGKKHTVSVKNYQESISDFKFDESTKSMIIESPFQWEHVQHIDEIRYNFEIPKSFSPFENVKSFSGTINGIPIESKNLHFDLYSSKESNTLHFVIDNEELMQLRNGGPSGIDVKITPELSSSIISKEIFFDNGYKAIVSYDSRYNQGKEILFSFVFFDSKGNLVPDIRYAYSVKEPSGKEFVNTGGNPYLLGISLPNGVDTRIISAPSEGKYSMQIVLIGTGTKDFERYMYKDFQFDITKSETQTQPLAKPLTKPIVPEWIKTNAGWWADGLIDDNSFVSGIQFMIQNKIINIPNLPSQASQNTNEPIPNWVKNNAGWWASGQISEDDFVNGIKHLVERGIIRV